MNWLQKINQNMGNPVTVESLLIQALNNELPVRDDSRGPGAATQIRNLAGASACEEIQASGVINGEANAVAGALMRQLGCDGLPDAPGVQQQQQQQQQMLTPDAFPALGAEQEKPMSMPSAEIV